MRSRCVRANVVRSLWIVLTSVTAALFGARTSLADETPSLGLEPAPAGDRAAFVERAAVRGHLLLAARVAVDYAHAPLVLVDSAQNDDVVVANQTSFHAMASLSLRHRFVLALDVPFSYFRPGPGSNPGSGAPRVTQGAEFGDIRFGARVRLYQSQENPDEGFVIGLSSNFWLPTASEGYAGDGLFRMKGAIVAEGANKRFYWGANAGVRSRPTAVLPGILPTRVGTALGLGLSGGFYADGDRAVAIGAEFVGDFTVGADARLFDPRATIANLLLTGHYRIAGGPFEVGGAFGPGLGQGAGSPDVRVMVFLGRAPEQMAPPPDRDDDGIPDKQDACVSLRGIPWPDPLLNGCPEAPADRDGDAIPDDYDACPTKAGEATFVRRTHGCPKIVDTDGDKVPDPNDACPKEAGVGPPDGDGCPKVEPKPEPPPIATVVDKEIVISQQVLFERGTAVIRPESDAILQDVARAFKEHPEIELVEVQGHTDDTGDDNLNRQLGRDRAESVVQWLVKNGVAKERLTAKGYGADKPIDTNATDEGRAKNRRVEFHILRRKVADKPAPAPAPAGGRP
jgi:OOP family OmpA-OmpF porin